MLFTHFCKTLRTTELDVSTATLMGTLTYWRESIVNLLLISLTTENAIFVLSSKLVIFIFSQCWSVKGLMRDARLGVNGR